MKTLLVFLVICTSLIFLSMSQALYALCGDADGSGRLDISDGVYLINYNFGGGPPPIPLENGDTNIDGVVSVLDAVYMINFIFIGGPIPCAEPSGYLIEYSNCKNFTFSGDTIITSNACLIWEYDGISLKITHVNAALNCCTNKAGDIEIVNNEITIDVIESGIPCFCLCLFDLTYEIIPLPNGVYHITVIDPFKPINDTALEITIDLADPIIDTLCVTRSGYPWN